jgi:hypothetical protein
MRKLFNHSLYWALSIGGAIAAVTGVAHVSRWLADTLGGDLSFYVFSSVVSGVFAYNVARTYQSEEADVHIRGKLGALWRITGALLSLAVTFIVRLVCVRGALAVALAYIAWVAWSDIGAYHQAHDTAALDALLIWLLFAGLAALAFAAGLESRSKHMRALRSANRELDEKYARAVEANRLLLAKVRAGMRGTAGTAGAAGAEGASSAGDELSSASLLAASQQFAAQV